MQPPDKPAWWDAATRQLVRADPVLDGLIAAYPGFHLARRSDAFTALARAIVGQQISVRAADSVWRRFVAHVAPAHARAPFPALAPERVARAGLADLRACGLSGRKAAYVRDLAAHFASGRLDPARWGGLDDEALIGALCEVKGIGRWTAEMFLIFHLIRPNVLPLDDLGLIKGISLNYFSGEPVSRAEAREVGEAWAPYRSVAVWYIWRSLDPLPVDY